MFNLFSYLFSQDLETREYVVFAKRITLPPNSSQVFNTFVVRAKSEYAAARQFDQEYTAWSRLSVEER